MDFIFHIYLAEPGLSCGIRDLVPWPGIEPRDPALGEWSLNHWTTKKSWEWTLFFFPRNGLLKCLPVTLGTSLVSGHTHTPTHTHIPYRHWSLWCWWEPEKLGRQNTSCFGSTVRTGCPLGMRWALANRQDFTWGWRVGASREKEEGTEVQRGAECSGQAWCVMPGTTGREPGEGWPRGPGAVSDEKPPGPILGGTKVRSELFRPPAPPLLLHPLSSS